MVGPALVTLARRKPVRWLGAIVLGGTVGAAGTVTHRASAPWGLVLALALVLATAVLARAWAHLPGLLAYGIGWVAVVQVLSLTGPGGDVLIPAKQVIGYAWLVGGMLMVAGAAFAPRRWFLDEPRTPVPVPAPEPEPERELEREPEREPETTPEITA